MASGCLPAQAIFSSQGRLASPFFPGRAAFAALVKG